MAHHRVFLKDTITVGYGYIGIGFICSAGHPNLQDNRVIFKKFQESSKSSSDFAELELQLQTLLLQGKIRVEMEHGTGGEGDTGQKPQRSLTGEEDGQKWQITFQKVHFDSKIENGLKTGGRKLIPSFFHRPSYPSILLFIHPANIFECLVPGTNSIIRQAYVSNPFLPCIQLQMNYSISQ